MATVNIADTHLTFTGTRYFRGRAENVRIGAFGEKKSPLLSANYLEVQGHIPTARFKVREATAADIDWSKTKESDFGGSVKYLTAKGAFDISFKRAQSAKLKLVKFVVEGENMRAAANDSPNILSKLSGYGGDARIAHEIWVAMEATLADTFANSTSLSASGDAGGVTISAKGATSSSGESTVTLSGGTTFAYLLVKLNWNDAKSRITKVTDDMWGLS